MYSYINITIYVGVFLQRIIKEQSINISHCTGQIINMIIHNISLDSNMSSCKTQNKEILFAPCIFG
jgi:Na+/H+ antiporter NhaD/arsenite permease-like protein